MKATSSAEAFDAEETVLGFKEKPDSWATRPLAVLIAHAITGAHRSDQSMEELFLERIRDELEILETAMAAEDEFGEGYDTDVSPLTMIHRLRVQCDAVSELSGRMRAARSEGGGFYGEIRREREANAARKPLDQRITKTGSRVSKARKVGRRAAR